MSGKAKECSSDNVTQMENAQLYSRFIFCGQIFTAMSYFLGKSSGELEALNESLQELLDGIQVSLL